MPKCRCGRELETLCTDEGTCCYVHADGTPECPESCTNCKAQGHSREQCTIDPMGWDEGFEIEMDRLRRENASLRGASDIDTGEKMPLYVRIAHLERRVRLLAEGRQKQWERAQQAEDDCQAAEAELDRIVELMKEARREAERWRDEEAGSCSPDSLMRWRKANPLPWEASSCCGQQYDAPVPPPIEDVEEALAYFKPAGAMQVTRGEFEALQVRHKNLAVSVGQEQHFRAKLQERFDALKALVLRLTDAELCEWSENSEGCKSLRDLAAKLKEGKG